MTSVSRRRLALGAAWTVPTALVAASAPVFATSRSQVTCPVPDVFLTIVEDGSVSSIAAGTLYENGTLFQVNLKPFGFPQPDFIEEEVTGYYLNWGRPSNDVPNSTNCTRYIDGAQWDPSQLKVVNTFKMTTWDGNVHDAVLTAATPVGCSPALSQEGVASSFSLQSSLIYDSGAIVEDKMTVKNLSVPFTLSYLDGLTPVKGCVYWANFVFNREMQPNMTFTWDITERPTFAS